VATRLEAAFTGSQNGCRHVAARFQRASDGGILPPVLRGISRRPQIFPTKNLSR